MQSTEHWNRIYAEKPSQQVSWYTEHLRQSLQLIAEAGLPADARILDVGGGASSLARDLLDRGFTDISVLDLAAAALEVAKLALGLRANQVQWLVGDITTIALPEAALDLWHDRAVFHFLTDPALRAAYVRQATRALRPGGHLIVATFGASGPERCSGLPVARYDERQLPGQFGDGFARVHCLEEVHVTPWGAQQQFTYCLCRRG